MNNSRSAGNKNDKNETSTKDPFAYLFRGSFNNENSSTVVCIYNIIRVHSVNTYMHIQHLDV